jgi:hypothetical protein
MEPLPGNVLMKSVTIHSAHMFLQNIFVTLFFRWLIYNPKDQDNQLKWLAETLLQSEKAAEKVHILGHIPSGDTECLRTWSREFHKIIERLVKYYITGFIINETTKSIPLFHMSYS